MGNQEEMGGIENLRDVSFSELLDSCTLPSGLSYELMPDTVDVALKVAEADDAFQWKKKLLQVLAVTKSIAGIDPRSAEGGGQMFLGSMLDVDVIFLALAWTAEMNKRKLKLDSGIPCPQCAEPWPELPLSPLKVRARIQAKDGMTPAQFPQVDVDSSLLPESLKAGGLFVGEPTWKESRSGIPANSWENSEVTLLHRGMASLWTKDTAGKKHRPVVKAEKQQLRMQVMQAIHDTMDKHVPSIRPFIRITCKNCGMEGDVPFDQAL